MSRQTRYLVCLLTLQLLFLPSLVEGRAASPAQERQPLGSLHSAGQVYVNNSPAPAESTVFGGDTVRTDPTSTATFTMAAKGAFQIASRSQVLFPGNQQYVAQLQSGILVMSSSSGPSGMILRAGNSLIVTVTQDQLSSARIESVADGSFRISCSQGSVGIVPLEGGAGGTFLQAGQSATLSAQGEVVTQAAPSSATPAQQTVAKAKTSHTGWIILGLAGAGGAAGAAAALAGHGGGQPISPSVP